MTAACNCGTPPRANRCGASAATLLRSVRPPSRRTASSSCPAPATIRRRSRTTAPCALWDTASARSLKEFSGHQDAVWSVAFSPDGKRTVSGSYDGTAHVWNLGKGREVCRFTGHKRSVHCVAFSPDGRRVASAGGDHLVRLWHPADGRQERGHRRPLGDGSRRGLLGGRQTPAVGER